MTISKDASTANFPAAGSADAETALSSAMEDDSIVPPSDEHNPYPGADNRAWTDRFSAALAVESGLPRDVTDLLAPYVVQPKDCILQGRAGAADSLRPAALSLNHTGQRVLRVRAHGFAGNAGEYNERIRTSFPSPVTPGADAMEILPTLVTGTGPSGELAPFLTTAEPVSPGHVNRLLGIMNRALDVADGDRGYNLAEDIGIYGQQEITTHVPLLRLIRESGAGDEPHIRRVVDLTAVKGANRSRARLSLFGLKPEEIVFGIKPKTIMGTQPSGVEETPIADPRIWVPQLANLLKAAMADPLHPGHAIARRAAKVAVVQLEIIIGGEPLAEFHNTVFDPNRVDHRRPPLDYQPRDKAASDFRALLRDYKAEGVLTEAERAWLAGEGADPAPVEGEASVDARDRRDRALLDVVFPPRSVAGAPPLWPRARRVLGEPPGSQTGRKNVDARARMYSAVSSDAYRARWNPRVLDSLFPATVIQQQRSYHDIPSWAELRVAFAGGDYSGLEQFISTRGMHWLAEHALVDADRGSMESQLGSTDGSGGERVHFVRRTMINIRTALVAKPKLAVALFNELARATNDGDFPRAIGEDGAPVPGSQATRVWFNETFPKARRTPLPPVPPEDPPEQPAPSPEQLLVVAQDHFQQQATEAAMKAIADLFDAGRELVAAAASAGASALPDGSSPTTESIERATAAAMADITTFASLITRLKFGQVAAHEFSNSQSAAFLNAEVD